jgi:hypothetical protein
MERSRLGLVLTVTLMAGAMTCGSSDPPSVIHLGDDLALAFCRHQFRCCSPAEIGEVSEGRYATEAECISFAKLSAEQQLAVLDNAIRTGHVTVEAGAAIACARKYEQRACNTSLQLPEIIRPVPDVAQALAACPGLLVGRVPPGSRCVIPEECSAGTRCYTGTAMGMSGAAGTGAFAPGLPPGGSAMGACVRTRGEGEICNETADCDATARLHCSRPDFVCKRRARVGEPCSFDGTGESTCDVAENLTCDFNQLVCRRPPSAGESCDEMESPHCDPDPEMALSCNRLTGLCTAPAGPGESCGAPALPPCRADLTCIPTQSDGTGNCGPPPAAGSPCSDKCASPAACDLNANVCREPGSSPIGAACADGSDCVTLNCGIVAGGTPVCMPSGRPVLCVGAGVTPGISAGAAGTTGAAGTAPSAGAGSNGAGGAAGTGT